MLSVYSHSPSSTHSPSSSHSPPDSQPLCSCHCQSSCHTQLGIHLALQMLHEFARHCVFNGTSGVLKPSFLSVAVGSGGVFSSSFTTLAVTLSLLRLPLEDVTEIVTFCGVLGVCHFTQTSWLSPAGITISVRV